MTKSSRKRQALKRSNAPTTLQVGGSFTIEAREGHAPTFRIHAYNGGLLPVAGFSHPVVVELSTASFEDTDQTYINRNHDQKREVGHADRAATSIDAEGIHLEGVFSHDNIDTQELITASQRGKKFKASIEASFPPAEFIQKGRSVRVNNKSFTGPVFIARHATITGVAILTRAADMESNVSIAANQKRDNMNEKLREYIEAQGFDADEVTDTQLQFLTAQFEQSQPAPEPIAEPEGDFSSILQKQRATQAAEVERAANVQRICAKYGDPDIEIKGVVTSLCAHAIKSGWDDRKVELEARLFQLDAEGGSFGIHDSAKNDGDAQTIECAMSMSNNYVTEDDVKNNGWYDEKTMNNALSDRFRGFRPSRLLHHVMASAGVYHPAGQMDDLFISQAVKANNKIMASGFTTVSIPGILSNVMNKTLLAAYTRAPSFIPFAYGQSNRKDFKPAFSYQLESSGQLEKIGADGQIKHGAIVESQYTSQLETYAKMLAWTRKMIIDDDLSSLSRTASFLGTMAFKSREFAATQVLVNSTMFSTGNGNLLTGNTLGIDGLTTSDIAFMGQTDSDGLPISINGDRLLVPSALKTLTNQLQNQTEIRDNLTDAKTFINNPWSGTFEGFATQWLDNELASAVGGVADADRAKTWYKFSDPSGGNAAFEVLYLNGVSTPMINSDDTDFNTTGMQFRALFDFSFGEADPKYAQKNVGA